MARQGGSTFYSKGGIDGPACTANACHFLELCTTPEHFSAVLGAGQKAGRALARAHGVSRSTYSVYTYVETSPPAVANAKGLPHHF